MSHETIFKESGESGNALTEEFEGMFLEYSLMVYRTAYSVTGSPQDAEDVLQTVFLWLLRRGIPAEVRSNPKAYLYRAAVNASLNVRKSRQRESAKSAAFRNSLDTGSTSPDSTPGLQDRLVAAISQLHVRAVEMLILRYEHNYSDAEIGKMLGKSRGVVAVTLYRARVRLAKLLKDTSGDHS